MIYAQRGLKNGLSSFVERVVRIIPVLREVASHKVCDMYTFAGENNIFLAPHALSSHFGISSFCRSSMHYICKPIDTLCHDTADGRKVGITGQWRQPLPELQSYCETFKSHGLPY